MLVLHLYTQQDAAILTAHMTVCVGVQHAEDAAYLVKFLLNGTTGTPMKDLMRTVTRTFRSKPVDKKTGSVSLTPINPLT